MFLQPLYIEMNELKKNYAQIHLNVGRMIQGFNVKSCGELYSHETQYNTLPEHLPGIERLDNGGDGNCVYYLPNFSPDI